MLKDIAFRDFQETVSDSLLYNRSILDILSKTQECNTRLHRSIVKAVTSCGCIKINAGKQEVAKEATLSDLKKLLDTHLDGKLCPSCRDVVETDMGRVLFYLAVLCNLLDVDLYDVIVKEQKTLQVLGVYNLA